MGGGRRARRCLRHGALAAQLGCAPGTVARAYGELQRAGLIASRDRARARVAVGGSPRARWWLAGGRELRLAGSDDPALDALVRAAGEAIEVVPGPRGSVHGLEAMARGQADVVLYWSMPNRGATTTPTSAVCCPESPSCWSTCGGARWAWSCRAATRWQCAGSAIWPADGWRGARGAADRVCCWSGCWPRPAWRLRPRAASPRTPTSPWPPRWRRAPPTPDWPCARSRAPAIWTSWASRSAVELAVRANDVDSAARAARAAARPGLHRPDRRARGLRPQRDRRTKESDMTARLWAVACWWQRWCHGRVRLGFGVVDEHHVGKRPDDPGHDHQHARHRAARHARPRLRKAGNCSVKTVAVGSGQALDLGARGQADVLLVHSPDAEQMFMKQGHGSTAWPSCTTTSSWSARPRIPPRSPAPAASSRPCRRIAKTKSPFASRADDSGTNAKELKLWQQAGITPSGSWYIKTGQGMGPTLDHRQPEGRVHPVRPRHLPGHQEPRQQDPRAGRRRSCRTRTT